jgi:hypothetical protein
MAMESRYKMTEVHEDHGPTFLATQPDPHRIKNPALEKQTADSPPVEELISCHNSMFDHLVAQFAEQAKEWAAADTPEKKAAFIDKYDPPRKKATKVKTPTKKEK